ncbi:hypothetical protein A1019T_01158 [Psychrobacter pasteurii]|uniref:Phage tail protein C-terminal domain-containing protein n=1 Tax=Psychrobacter pasteurii TaxID=1945520 RepID=A0A1R4EFB4_9GAMM|nr:pyocin knob domain-containing protein [Psychrobacter pasteurii]SJM37187.1 hypothetical protein A1019T_01158 [Psychrobacter pasteurii]
MAIKLPDPGNGIPEQKTGNDEWTNMQIVRENFADKSNAASRLVGTADGQVPLAEDIAKLAGSQVHRELTSSQAGSTDFNDYVAGERVYSSTFAKNAPNGSPSYVFLQTISTRNANKMNRLQVVTPAFGSTANMWLRVATGNADLSWSAWAKVYTDQNTTKEAGTGYLVASSPVLKVQHDSFEKVHEAEQLDIEVKNIKTGVYEITGTTGLRENDGWNLKPPKDVNGNVLCICEATERNGVITLKTYKKKFDFETVSIVADYEQPTDIPEGAVVMLRFNDLPQEQLDEPTI